MIHTSIFLVIDRQFVHTFECMDGQHRSSANHSFWRRKKEYARVWQREKEKERGAREEAWETLWSICEKWLRARLEELTRNLIRVRTYSVVGTGRMEGWGVEPHAYSTYLWPECSSGYLIVFDYSRRGVCLTSTTVRGNGRKLAEGAYSLESRARQVRKAPLASISLRSRPIPRAAHLSRLDA